VRRSQAQQRRASALCQRSRGHLERRTWRGGTAAETAASRAASVRMRGAMPRSDSPFTSMCDTAAWLMCTWGTDTTQVQDGNLTRIGEHALITSTGGRSFTYGHLSCTYRR
jgi:hypothetical protein